MNHLIKKAQKIFADTIRVKALGGQGGHGLPQYGGVGGRGGDVCVVGSVTTKRLDSILRNSSCKNGWFIAANGRPATRTRLLGQPGDDLQIKVPLGVSVTDSDGHMIGDINEEDQKFVVALGGKGGDKFTDHHGMSGQRRVLRLDYKMISDAVFVGFPNAGKSSLLRAVSKSKVKVANYPFTTLRPYLGISIFDDDRRITFADLPGIVEGAHKNIGLGHEFLKHIVRSRVLIFVIDLNDVEISSDYARRSPLETMCILNKEIELYDDRLLNKPAILAVNKVDSFTHGDYLERFIKIKQEIIGLQDSDSDVHSSLGEDLRPKRFFKMDDVLPISAKNILGIDQLRRTTRDVIDKYAEQDRLDRDEDQIRTYKELLPLEHNRLMSS